MLAVLTAVELRRIPVLLGGSGLARTADCRCYCVPCREAL
jgi:hypothetical protein